MGILGTVINIAVWVNWLTRIMIALTKKNGYNRFLIISAFLLPFYSASFGIAGLQISIYKMLPLALLITYLLSKNLVSIKLVLVILYFFVLTFMFYNIALDANLFEFIISLGRAEFSAYISPIVQGGLFLMVILQIWLVRKNASLDHLKILSCYIYGCIILVIIGYIQLFFYFTGTPWFEFWWLNDAVGRAVEGGLNSHAFDTGFYRMSSLGGEPRHFSAILSLSLLIQQYLKSTGIKIRFISSRYSILTSLFILSGMLFSMSASGILGLVVGFGIYLFFTDKVKALIITLLLVFLIFLLAENTFVGKLLWKLSSFEMMLYAAKKDAFALQAIVHNWGHFMFGYGMNLADLYVPDYYLIQETPFGLQNRHDEEAPMSAAIVPTSALLQILLNGGIIGTLLVLGFFYREIRFCRRTTKYIMISILGMTAVSSTLIFSMAIFFFAIIIQYEAKSAP
ncbi:hypothetical protein N9564_01915 [Amylibacter sp.]|jgi:hypothetical protein|nr:hypothetical protein [Amylibacter sp.]